MKRTRKTTYISNRLVSSLNSSEIVSTDFYSSEFASVIDAQATFADGIIVTLYCWYDNEYGYSCQVYRVLERMAGIRYQTYPVKSPYPL